MAPVMTDYNSDQPLVWEKLKYLDDVKIYHLKSIQERQENEESSDHTSEKDKNKKGKLKSQS